MTKEERREQNLETQRHYDRLDAFARAALTALPEIHEDHSDKYIAHRAFAIGVAMMKESAKWEVDEAGIPYRLEEE